MPSVQRLARAGRTTDGRTRQPWWLKLGTRVEQLPVWVQRLRTKFGGTRCRGRRSFGVNTTVFGSLTYVPRPAPRLNSHTHAMAHQRTDEGPDKLCTQRDGWWESLLATRCHQRAAAAAAATMASDVQHTRPHAHTCTPPLHGWSDRVLVALVVVTDAGMCAADAGRLAGCAELWCMVRARLRAAN